MSSLPSPPPSPIPSHAPSPVPTLVPTPEPSPLPSYNPTPVPTYAPSSGPTPLPTSPPSPSPTLLPTGAPSPLPTVQPTSAPSPLPTLAPTTALVETNCYTLTLEDTEGDGWDGAYWYWKNGDSGDSAYGNVFASGTMDDGATSTSQICAYTRVGCYDFVVTDGDYPTEISWEIETLEGSTVYDEDSAKGKGGGEFGVDAYTCT